MERFSAVLLSPWVTLVGVRILGVMLRDRITEDRALTVLRLQYETGDREYPDIVVPQREGAVREALQVLVAARVVREREDYYWLNHTYVDFPRLPAERRHHNAVREARRRQRAEARAALQALAGVADAHHS